VFVPTRSLVQASLGLAFVLSACGDDLAPVVEPEPEPEDPRSAQAVCQRWNDDRADRREGVWQGGNTFGCVAGTLDTLGLENTLRQVNLYRWLAELPPVTHDPELNAAAQACSLIMDANRDIEHDVPPSWRCHSTLGAEAAQLSNLATTPAVFAVDLYIDDEGIESLGHRRWIFNNRTGPIGIGSTRDYSCLHLLSGQSAAPNPWIAWPPPGFVPLHALHQPTRFGAFDIDRAGWSVQSESIDLTRGIVTVQMDGEPVAVQTRPLASGYGSRYAIGIVPVDFATRAGSSYRVTITLPREVIEYSFEVVDCEG